MSPKTKLYLKIVERVVWTFVQAFLAAVLILPGDDLFSPVNLKIGLVGALASTVKNIAAARVSGGLSPATLPASVTAAGQVVGEVTGTVVSDVGEIVGEVTGTVVGDIDSHERGAGPIFLLVIAAVVLVILFFGTCDVLIDDEDEDGDNHLLGRVVLIDHEYDGGSDGNSGGEYEGGRGGSDYDGDGDGNRCRNFCVYGVPVPEPGGEESNR